MRGPLTLFCIFFGTTTANADTAITRSYSLNQDNPISKQMFLQDAACAEALADHVVPQFRGLTQMALWRSILEPLFKANMGIQWQQFHAYFRITS